MKNEKLDGTPATAIAPSPKATAELIPEPTARLVEKCVRIPHNENRYYWLCYRTTHKL